MSWDEYWDELRYKEEMHQRQMYEDYLREEREREESEWWESWWRDSQDTWRDGAWGLRKMPGDDLEIVVHYCTDFEFGNSANRVDGYCSVCEEKVPGSVVAIHMFLNPSFYDKSK